MKRKILVVDDQQVNRLILKKILSGAYEVLEAAHGGEALEWLRAQGDEIALVILDLVMPVLDGYGLLEAMANDARWSDIPTLVATQAEKGEAEERALQCGARDFITKPYNPGVLLRRMENLIGLRESSKRIAVIERDYLTDVFTKEAFCTRVSELLAQNPAQEYAMVATDIENFKIINEVYGTEEGDHLLQYIAKGIRKDAHEAGGICGRYGSDHFVFFVPTHGNREHLEEAAGHAGTYLNAYPKKLRMSVKYGIYLVEDRTLSPIVMCDRARMAAESVKGRYNSSYAYYDASMRQRMLEEQEITNEMHRALAEKQFEVYYQPKYDLDSECIAGS